MRKNMNFLPMLILSLLFIFLFPYLSSADYLIELKNGRTIDVHDYKDEGDRIKFTSYGGEIIMDKSLIKEIKKIEIKPYEGPLYYEENEKEKPAASAEERKSDTAMSEPGTLSVPDSIQKQKEALVKEGEELGKKREELLNDIKQEGRLVLPSKKREFEKRWNEVEGEIKEFNEKVKSMEDTEKPGEENTESSAQEVE